jgi:hypothetical protein
MFCDLHGALAASGCLLENNVDKGSPKYRLQQMSSITLNGIIGTVRATVGYKWFLILLCVLIVCQPIC